MADATPAVAAPVEAQTEGAEHTYKFNVSMSCGGCSGAVNRVLGKLDGMYFFFVPLPRPSALLTVSPYTASPPSIPSSSSITPLCPPQLLIHPTTKTKISANHLLGVKSYDVSLDTQTATVVTSPTLEYDTVLRTIAKTGKKVNSGEADGETRSVEVIAA